MEYVYNANTKVVQDKTYYFVKKIMALPEFKGMAEIVIGYGMHTDFEKACSIAGIYDSATRQQLLLELEQQQNAQKNIAKHSVQIEESVNLRLVKLGAEMLN